MIPSYLASPLRRQVFFAFLLKVVNALAVFFIVRLAIDLIGDSDFGVWLAFFSAVTWFSCVEVGVSSAIRNDLTRTFDAGVDERGSPAVLVSTAMALELAVYTALLAVAGAVLVVIDQLGWLPYPELLPVGRMLLLGAILFLGYVFSMVNTVAMASHRAHLSVAVTFVQNAVTIGGILVFQAIGWNSFRALALLIATATLIAPLALHLSIYRRQWARALPSWRAIDFGALKPYRKAIWQFGSIQFFILIIFATDNVIVASAIDPGHVTSYNAAFRYFNVLNVLFNLVLVPYWAAITAAHHRRDHAWVARAKRTLVMAFSAMALMGFVMLIVSPYAYEFWLADRVNIPFQLSAIMLLSVLLTMWNFVFAYYFSGVGEVSLYRTLTVIGGLANIPLSLLLAQKMGSSGVILATCLALLPQAIILPIKAFQTDHAA